LLQWFWLHSFFAGTAAAFVQEKELSHRERFAPPHERQERIENDATLRLQANPNDVEALIQRGLARVRLGNLPAAEVDFRRAGELDVTSADAWANLAFCLWRQERFPEALEAAQAALALDPGQASAHYYAGRLLLLIDGEEKQAIEHLERAVELNATEVIRFDLLAAYLQVGDVVKASFQLRLLRELLPPGDARILHAEGLLAADLGHRSRAVDYFQKAWEADPDKISVRQDYGVTLARVERWQEAIAILGPLTQERPRSFPAAYYYALSLKNTGRLEEAEREIRRALSLNPQSAEAHHQLGLVLQSTARLAEAAREFAIAARLNPDLQSQDNYREK